MSKYTSKRRSGGGRLTAQILNSMASATNDSEFAHQITYTRPLSVASLGASNFTSTPSDATGITLAQTGPSEIRVTFNDPVELDTAVDFNGNAGAFVSPQTIPIT